jgi:thiaminase/transcriptional activator TenA
MTFVQECIAFAGPVWDRYIHHPWIEALFAGTLSDAQFEYWLAQDLPYLGERITAVALGKAPHGHAWAKLELEYLARANATRVERDMLTKYGEWATTRWAARPRREAFINFFVRTAYEGTFGEICCAYYPCYAFPDTFGLRYQAERPQGLPPRQVAWVEQWVDPFFIALRDATADAINEYGAYATPYDQEKMKWIMLRATNHQIGTFDAAWNLSDPWPGEGQETGVMASAPQAEPAA